MNNAEWISTYQENLLGVFGQPQACFTHGKGTRVWDADGKEYLDLLAGIAVNALGYAHPEIVKTIGEQASRFTHVSNFSLPAAGRGRGGSKENLRRRLGQRGTSGNYFPGTGTVRKLGHRSQ